MSYERTSRVEKAGLHFRLNVVAVGVMAEFTHIEIYDGYDKRVVKGYGNVSCKLPQGIYRGVFELNEKTIERIIRLDKEVTENVEMPMTSSAFPLEGLESTYEYYSNEAEKNSLVITHGKNTKPKGSLFFFFRYPNEQIWERTSLDKEGLGTHFTLFDENHELVSALKDKAVVENKRFGSMSFNAALAPGTYFLNYGGEPIREIPFTVFSGWQTQVFMMFNGKPLFNSMRISIEKKEAGFDKGRTSYFVIDSIMQKFQNGIYFLPDRDLEYLAYGKWKNPMMAILGAYIYLITGRQDKDNLFRLVVDNTSKKILKNRKAPDVIAMKILKAIHYNEPLKELHLSMPCMLMPYLKTITSATPSFRGLIKPNSFAEKILTQLYSDCLWTSYVPVKTITKRKASRIKSARSNPSTKSITIGTKARSLKTIKVFGEPVKVEILNTGAEMQEVRKSLSGVPMWVSEGITDLLNSKRGAGMSANELAKSLRVTPNIVSKALHQMKRTPSDTQKPAQVVLVNPLKKSEFKGNEDFKISF